MPREVRSKRGAPSSSSRLIRTLDDGWTIVTADGRLSAQFEHTVLVTREGCEVLTRIDAIA